MAATAYIKIPFHLCDPAKILFFGAIYEIYHQFLEDHVSDFDIYWSDWFKGPAGAPIRAVKTSYNAPLFFGETYPALLKVTEVGESSVTMTFIVGPEDAPRIHTEVTHCFIDPKTAKKTAIPSKIKAALTKALQDS